MKKTQLIAVVITLLAVLSGCTGNQKATVRETTVSSETSPAVRETFIPDGETASQQKLQFSVVEAEEPGYTVVSKEELGGNANTGLTYGQLAEVNIAWDGEIIPLAAAIREGKLTAPELFAFARIDAQNGFCQENYVSEHGLTHFSYTYPECVLELAYDVYETPDGNQTLIEEVCITDHESSVSHFYVDESSKWGYFLDREDWGLTFEVSDVSPTQITLGYTQRQGQEIGELLLEDYILYPAGASWESGKGPGSIGKYKKGLQWQPIPILSDASGQITIDWSADAGQLEPGNYFLQMSILDNYEESEVHPLMVNYYDRQRYCIEFTVE